jgi:hypothetical protein
MTPRVAKLAAAFGMAALVSTAAWAADSPALPPACKVPAGMLAVSSPLQRAAKQIKSEQRLKIVALGSSSTLGMGASGPAGAYPARLEAALQAILPASVTIQVVNKGMARQSAEQMRARIEMDVIAEKPSLAIWETGTSEAVRGADVDEFIDLLLAGIDRMNAAGIDVVLIATQYFRNTAQLINYQPYVVAMDRVAGMRNLVLFPRFSVMRYWADHDRFNFEGKSPVERRQITDEIYDCLGRLVAHSLIEGLKR